MQVRSQQSPSVGLLTTVICAEPNEHDDDSIWVFDIGTSVDVTGTDRHKTNLDFFIQQELRSRYYIDTSFRDISEDVEAVNSQVCRMRLRFDKVISLVTSFDGDRLTMPQTSGELTTVTLRRRDFFVPISQR